MIKVKITQHGGYIMGDGTFPYDPDVFFKRFMHKFIRHVGEELELSDEEVAEVMQRHDATFDAAPVVELDDNAPMEELLGEPKQLTDDAALSWPRPDTDLYL
jgi:hypothetical protein